MPTSKKKCKLNDVVIRLINYIPNTFKSVFRFLGFNRLLYYFLDKHTTELAFQIGWAREFKSNNDKVLVYWKKHRYLDEIIRICKIKNDTKILDMESHGFSRNHFTCKSGLRNNGL